MAIAASVLAASSYVIAPAQAATVWDAATDFSTTGSNPNGVWSYGYTNTLGGTFNLYPDTQAFTPGIDAWYKNAINSALSVFRNSNPVPDPLLFGTGSFRPGQLGFHPGPNGEYSVVRWKAPASGSFNLTSSFIGVDYVYPTSSDVHVLKNGTSLFSAPVNSYNVSIPFSTSLLLNAGDLIDFTVGFGSNGNYFGDATGLSVKITTAVPEPSSILGILSLGALGIGLALKRKS